MQSSDQGYILQDIVYNCQVNCLSHHPKLNLEEIVPGERIGNENGITYWHIANFTWDMPKTDVIDSVSEIFRLIQPHYFYEFQPTSSQDLAHITIHFKKNGDEDLPSPFLPRVLAYAYAPYQGQSDAYFNDDLDWTRLHQINSISLLKVGVHEVLHTLNFGHSSNPIDIAYAQYVPNNEINFTQDTVQSIYNKYGIPQNQPTEKNREELFKVLNIAFPTHKHLSKLPETTIVELANYFGIEASRKDLKSNTVDKVITLIQKEINN